MSSKIKQNLTPNFLCPDCSNIPLLGFNFAYESKNISDVCELFSYCIYNHDHQKNQVKKINFENLFKTNSEKSKKKKNNLTCEFCKEKKIEYHCIECRRNICNDCFINDKGNKYYNNKEYISEDELKNIKRNFDESQKNVKKNLKLIQEKIDEYESKLEELKSLYEKYKDINDKLISFSNYILNLYTDLAQSKEEISYPIYFNLKNILLFNPTTINLEDINNVSITSFINSLNAKLTSGFYFPITNSNFSENLIDSNKSEKIINFDLIKLDNFTKKEVKYNKMLPFINDKIIGIENLNKENTDERNSNNENSDKTLDIYNIKNQSIETSINLEPPEKVFFNEQYDILIFQSPKILYILNPKDFSIKQEFSANHIIKRDKKKEGSYGYSSFWNREREELNEYECPGKFVHSEILSNNSFVVVFNGDIRRLGENYGGLFNTKSLQVINFEDKCYYNNEYKNYLFLIMYEKENEIFVPKTVKPLLRNQIYTCEVDYVTGKHCEIEEKEPYCEFNLKSMIKIKEDEYILSFESKIVTDLDQYYYYITDKVYKNEIIYYNINIKTDEKINNKIISTNKKSVLLKNEQEKFYFLCDKSEVNNNELKSFFDINKIELKTYKFTTEEQVSNFFVKNNTVIGWDNNLIYLCKAFEDKLEIINKILFKNQNIKFISLDNNYVFYNKNTSQDRRYNNNDDDSNEDSIEEEEYF